MREQIDPYALLLGFPESETPPDHYQLLRLRRFESDEDLIRERITSLYSRIQDLAPGSDHVDACQILLNHIGRAKVVLLNDQKRREYDLALKAGRVPVNDSFKSSESIRQKKSESKIETDVPQSKSTPKSKKPTSKSPSRTETFGDSNSNPTPGRKKAPKRVAKSPAKPVSKPKRRSDLASILVLAGAIFGAIGLLVWFLVLGGLFKVALTPTNAKVASNSVPAKEMGSTDVAEYSRPNSDTGEQTPTPQKPTGRGRLPQFDLNNIPDAEPIPEQPNADKKPEPSKQEKANFKQKATERAQLQFRQIFESLTTNRESPNAYQFVPKYLFKNDNTNVWKLDPSMGLQFSRKTESLLKLTENEAIQLRLERGKNCGFSHQIVIGPLKKNSSSFELQTPFCFTLPGAPNAAQSKMYPANGVLHINGSQKSELIKSEKLNAAITMELEFWPENKWGAKRATLGYKIKLSDEKGETWGKPTQGNFRLGKNQSGIQLFAISMSNGIKGSTNQTKGSIKIKQRDAQRP